MSDHDNHDSHGNPALYIKIWFLLLVLLVISVVGPELDIKVVTLITAFGIAIVKAYIVAAYYMHLKYEKTYVWYMMFACLFFMAILFAGVAVDVLNDSGHNWDNFSKDKTLEEIKAMNASLSESGTSASH